MRRFSESEVDTAVAKLPGPVRDAVYSPDTIAAVVSIAEKHQLHVDKIGALAELNRNMLLGLISPADLMNEMRTMAIGDVEAGQIAKDLNEQIFKPLHDAMRAAKGDTSRQPAPPLANVPAPLGYTPVTPPAPIYTAPAPSVAPPPPVIPPAPPAPVVPEPVAPLPIFEPAPRPTPPAASFTPAPQFAPPAPPTPKSYGNDPYREPIEPSGM